MNSKLSILLSIFRRKGAEGRFTKIIGENDRSQYKDLLSTLEAGEIGLIIFYKHILDWWLLTDRRMVTSSNVVMLTADIVDVFPALQEEFKDMVTSKNEFTRLLVKDRSDRTYLLRLEKGAPYEGFYQVLHFIAVNNRHTE